MPMEFLRKQAFGLLILLCATVSFAFPSAFDAWFGVKLTKLVVPAIQLIMFGMGTASNVIAYLAGANVALSVTMTCCSTLLSPLLTPLLMKTLAGRFVEIDFCAMVVSILQVVLVPVLAGGLVRWAFRRPLEAHKPAVDRALSIVSMAGICYTILALTAPSRATFREAGALIVVAAVLHNSFGYIAGYWLTRLLGRFLPFGETDARTVAIEVAMQNGGMAGALAVDVLGSPVAALPANVFSIWMNFSGSIIANWWKGRRS